MPSSSLTASIALIASNMIVSTKGRYALRVMVCFAQRGTEEYIPLKEIAGILDAPDFDRNRVLEQQIALLEKHYKALETAMDFLEKAWYSTDL